MADGMKGLASGLRPKGGMAEKKAAAPKAEKMGAEPKGDGGGAIELHDHGDGTAHTVIGGKEEQHPDHMHAVAHIAHHLAPESSHFHAKHDGFSGHTHGVHESGEHSETKEHESPDGMHQEMDAMLGGGEQAGDASQDQGEAEAGSSLGGFQG